MDRYNGNNRSRYNYFSYYPSNVKYTSVPDPLHLLKRIRYRLLKRPLSTTNRINDQCINKDDLEFIFDVLDPRVLQDKMVLKMRDDIAHKMFSFKTLESLPKNVEQRAA